MPFFQLLLYIFVESDHLKSDFWLPFVTSGASRFSLPKAPTIRRLRESSLFRVASEANDERTLACESIRFFRRKRSDDRKYVSGLQGKRTRERVANPREAVASFSAPVSHLFLCVLLARVPLSYIP